MGKMRDTDFAIVTPALDSRKAGSLAGASLPPWKRGYFQTEIFQNGLWAGDLSSPCGRGRDLLYFHQKKGCIFPAFRIQWQLTLEPFLLVTQN